MLQRAKGDVSQLSSFELLRKDQKTADGAGLSAIVSSVPMLVKVRQGMVPASGFGVGLG